MDGSPAAIPSISRDVSAIFPNEAPVTRFVGALLLELNGVTGVSAAQSRADMRVIVEITRFEAIAGREVIIEAHWWLRAVDTKSGTEGESVARMKVRGGPQDYDAIVAAEAAALAEIGANLSRAIEKEVAH